jgi:hypothetical protein
MAERLGSSGFLFEVSVLINHVKHAILTVKEESKDGTHELYQQQGADHRPSRSSQAPWT